jgi:hypothetical protein
MSYVLSPGTTQVFPVVDAGRNKKMSLAQLLAWLPSVMTLAVTRLTQSGANTGDSLVWSGTQWTPTTITGTGVASDTVPNALLGNGKRGTGTTYARGDHTHPLTVKRTIGVGETWTIAEDECVVVAGDWTINGDLTVNDHAIFVVL